MLTLLLLFAFIWLFVKAGIGVFKILFFILACGLVFVFFVHLLLPLVVVGGLIFLALALIRL